MKRSAVQGEERRGWGFRLKVGVGVEVLGLRV